MNNTNEFLRDYWTLAQRARDFELNPLPDDVNIRTFRNLTLMIITYLVYCLLLISFVPPMQDYSDTGVGCIDDCLEPLTKE